MNLKNAKMAIPTYKKFLLGGGGLFAAAECAFIMLFLPYMAQLNIHLGIAIPVVIVSVSLPCFIMPLVYALINGSTVISTGRYHLPLVICTLLCSLFNVLLFSLNGGGLAPVLLFIYLFGLSLTMQIYFYIYCSITTRMDSSAKTDSFRIFFSCIGILIAAGLVLWLNDGTASAISNISCIISIIIIASLLFVYISSCSAMPFFIRIEPSSNYTLRQNYMRYIAPVKEPRSRLALIAIFLMSAAVILGLFSYWLIGKSLAVEGLNLNLGFAVIICAVILFMPLLKFMYKKNSSKWVSAFGILAAAITCALMVTLILLMFLPRHSYAATIAFYLACVLYGVVAAILLAAQKPIHSIIKATTQNSFGNIYSLMCAVTVVGLSVAAALAIGGVLASRHINSMYVSTFIMCLTAAIMIASAVVLHLCLSRHKEGTDANS